MNTRTPKPQTTPSREIAHKLVRRFGVKAAFGFCCERRWPAVAYQVIRLDTANTLPAIHRQLVTNI